MIHVDVMAIAVASRPGFEYAQLMAQVGRNERCPCGSGKKFKQCCGHATAVAAPSAWHDVDRRLVDELAKLVRKRAPATFRPADVFPYPLSDDELVIFLPWMLYELRFDGERRAVDVLLDERGPRLASRDRTWLLANTRAWLSAWQVTTVEPGQGMTLVDRLTGAVRNVHEVAASRTLTPGLWLLARVVEVEGVSVLCGMHPRAMSPKWGSTFVDEARRALRVRKKLVPIERLRAEGAAELLLRIWHDLAELMDNEPAPQLCNTDGDPLLHTTDHFAVEPTSHDAVVAALATIPLAEHERASGEDIVTLLRAGNPMHPEWANTMVARVRASGTKLIIETNSVQRADAVRKLIESALATAGLTTAVQHRARAHEDVVAEVSRRMASGRAPPAREMSADEAQAVREVKEAHYRAWLDQPLPMFGGKTPRTAAKIRALRADVESALL